MPAGQCDVLIAGGGPSGLMLSIELQRRGVSVVLVDDKPGTAFNPQANATQARTMEYYRRLGFASEVRFIGLPADYPTDIAYFNRFAEYELARFQLPSARDAHNRTSPHAQGWSAAELPHRVSQKFVEQILRRHAEASGASVNYGWRLTGFADRGDGVDVTVEPVDGGPGHGIRAKYLVGCDGPRSFVRRQLGYRYTGARGVVRDFMGGRMYAIYVNCPNFYQVVRHPRAWMYVAYNMDRRAFMAAVDGQRQFAFHTQLRDNEREEAITERDAEAMFVRAVGAPVEVEILSRQSWTAGHALVAESFGEGRVLLGGDAVHLFTPAGGLGYNTAVEDAVNLGWKLAHVVKGKAPPALVSTYGIERQHVARRNTGYAQELADSLAYVPAPADIGDATAAGEAARKRAGDHLSAHARKEFNIPGITLGTRYDHSPIIIGDGSSPPPEAMNRYEPTSVAGGRPPHAWLGEGRSLFDGFGFDWTLLRLGPRPADGGAFVAAAASLGLDLKVLDVADDGLRQLYDRDLALVRPDQMIAWRGNDAKDAENVLRRAIGIGLAEGSG